MDKFRDQFDFMCQRVGRMLDVTTLKSHPEFPRLRRIYIFMCNDETYDQVERDARLSLKELEDVSRRLMRRAIKAWNDEILYGTTFLPARRLFDDDDSGLLA